MIPRAIGIACLLLLPAVAAFLAGFDDYARVAVVGAVLAYFMGSLARPIARFGVLIPVVYAAAALTANFTGGVAALIVAIAAATGAASSLGYHRALLAVLAAALIGSFEPASAPVVFGRTLGMFAGCLYGVVLVATLGNGFATHPRAVQRQDGLELLGPAGRTGTGRLVHRKGGRNRIRVVAAADGGCTGGSLVRRHCRGARSCASRWHSRARCWCWRCSRPCWTRCGASRARW